MNYLTISWKEMETNKDKKMNIEIKNSVVTKVVNFILLLNDPQFPTTECLKLPFQAEMYFIQNGIIILVPLCLLIIEDG